MAEGGLINEEKEESKTHRCTKNFQAILVGGFLAPIQEVKEAAWQLCACIYDLPASLKRQNYDRVISIEDTSTSLLDVVEDDVTKLLDAVFNTGRCDDGVTCAIFAHSHGAKIVKNALSKSTMRDYLRHKEYTEDEERAIIDEKRNNMAIFTLGGTLNLPKKYGRVCINIQLENDAKSYFAKKILGKKNKQEDEEVNFCQIPTRPGSSGRSRGILHHFLDLTSVGDSRHVMFEYFSMDRVMAIFVDCLSLNEDTKCSCEENFAASPQPSRSSSISPVINSEPELSDQETKNPDARMYEEREPAKTNESVRTEKLDADSESVEDICDEQPLHKPKERSPERVEWPLRSNQTEAPIQEAENPETQNSPEHSEVSSNGPIHSPEIDSSTKISFSARTEVETVDDIQDYSSERTFEQDKSTPDKQKQRGGRISADKSPRRPVSEKARTTQTKNNSTSRNIRH